MPDIESGRRTQRPSQTSPARVLLIDDHPIIRTGMVHLLNTDDEIEPLEPASSAESGLEQLTDEVDVVVVDLKMEGLDGLAFTRLAKRTRPDLPILVLSSYDETLYAEQALEAHSSGYLMKRADPDQLLAAIHTIRAGGVALSSTMWSRLLPAGLAANPLPRGSEATNALFSLLAGVPRPPHAIARALGIPLGHARRRLHTLASTLGLASEAQLVLYAHQDDPRF